MAGKEIAAQKYVMRLSAEDASSYIFDPFGQALGAITDKGAHRLEVGCLGGPRRLERGQD